jgi:hypothetical protein
VAFAVSAWIVLVAVIPLGRPNPEM